MLNMARVQLADMDRILELFAGKVRKLIIEDETPLTSNLRNVDTLRKTKVNAKFNIMIKTAIYLYWIVLRRYSNELDDSFNLTLKRQQNV